MSFLTSDRGISRDLSFRHHGHTPIHSQHAHTHYPTQLNTSGLPSTHDPHTPRSPSSPHHPPESLGSASAGPSAHSHGFASSHLKRFPHSIAEDIASLRSGTYVYKIPRSGFAQIRKVKISLNLIADYQPELAEIWKEHKEREIEMEQAKENGIKGNGNGNQATGTVNSGKEKKSNGNAGNGTKNEQPDASNPAATSSSQRIDKNLLSASPPVSSAAAAVTSSPKTPLRGRRKPIADFLRKDIDPFNTYCVHWESKRKKKGDAKLVLDDNTLIYDGCDRSEDSWEYVRDDLLDILKHEERKAAKAKGIEINSDEWRKREREKRRQREEEIKKLKAERRRRQQMLGAGSAQNESDIISHNSYTRYASTNTQLASQRVLTSSIFLSDIAPFCFSIFSPDQRELDLMCCTKEEKDRWVRVCREILVQREMQQSAGVAAGNSAIAAPHPVSNYANYAATASQALNAINNSHLNVSTNDAAVGSYSSHTPHSTSNSNPPNALQRVASHGLAHSGAPDAIQTIHETEEITLYERTQSPRDDAMERDEKMKQSDEAERLSREVEHLNGRTASPLQMVLPAQPSGASSPAPARSPPISGNANANVIGGDNKVSADRNGNSSPNPAAVVTPLRLDQKSPPLSASGESGAAVPLYSKPPTVDLEVDDDSVGGIVQIHSDSQRNSRVDFTADPAVLSSSPTDSTHRRHS